MKKENCIVFGPWIGELGYELMFWHGYIRRLCVERYHDHHRIAVSYSGRKILYDECDDFIPIPDNAASKLSNLCGHKTSGNTVDLSRWFSGLINELKKGFKRIEIIRPGFDAYGVSIGLRNNDKEKIFEIQDYRELTPNSTAAKFADDIIGDEDAICILARTREGERGKNNWIKDEWISFINRLTDKGFLVVITGKNENHRTDVSSCDLIGLEGDRIINTVHDITQKGMDYHVALAQKSQMCVCNQTGGQYIFALSGTPLFVFADKKHGPPGPRLKYFPVNYKVEAVENVKAYKASQLIESFDSFYNSIYGGV
jgi:hypothetical protein